MAGNNYRAINELNEIIDGQMDITAELMMAKSIIDIALERSTVATSRLEAWKKTHLDSLKKALGRRSA